MNRVFLCGRVSNDPAVSYVAKAEQNNAVARFNFAVTRTKEITDFISCKAFGKTAEIIERSVKKGTKLLIEGHIITGSYDKDGKKVYTTDVAVDRIEFCEPKQESQEPAPQLFPGNGDGPFMKIPDNVSDEGLPFN